MSIVDALRSERLMAEMDARGEALAADPTSLRGSWNALRADLAREHDRACGLAAQVEGLLAEVDRPPPVSLTHAAGMRIAEAVRRKATSAAMLAPLHHHASAIEAIDLATIVADALGAPDAVAEAERAVVE